MRLSLIFLSLSFLFSSCQCSRNILSVFTEVVDYTELASYQINTPDPRQDCPDYGQRIHISWLLDDFNETSQIRAKIRFRNLTEVDWEFDLEKNRGMRTYALLNEEYEDTGGFLTYKVELIQDGQIIEESRQALWTELIQFKN